MTGCYSVVHGRFSGKNERSIKEARNPKKKQTKKQKTKKNTVPGNRQRSPAADWPIDPSRRGTRRSIVLHARRHQRRRPKQKQKKTKLKKKETIDERQHLSTPDTERLLPSFFFLPVFFSIVLIVFFLAFMMAVLDDFLKKKM